MDTKFQRSKGRDSALPSLNLAIEAINLAKEISSITPAKAVFGSVSVLLTMIRDSMVNKLDYVELGLACAEVCKALDRGMNGRRLDELSRSVREAIEQLTITVAKIQGKIIEKSGRNLFSRLARATNDKDAIATWRMDLNRILHVFNTELAINTHVIVSDVHHGVANTQTMVSDIHRNMLKGQEGADDQHRSTRASMVGESPPPQPRVFYGRDALIEKIVDLAENLTPIALIGAGGIGKTSIALTVLHDDRIKEQFGHNRRFIRCDQFPASLTHFLRRLSIAIGAGVENPEDLAPLRPFLSSKMMLIILDNAESVLDPQGTDVQEIYAVVEELSQFSNISLCITSRISTIPPYCKLLDIPTLSMDAACNTFYRIFDSDERSNLVDDILKQLDFHPLSITLPATVACHNKWDTDRLAREWQRHRTGVLHVQHNKSLASTIELSLASPMFQELGPDARNLLEVIAFFPQGIDENNLAWLFPTIPNRTNIFDHFCILSLTYRSNGFVTMLAPLRDYLCPKDPVSSRLLCTTKGHYFSRLSFRVGPDGPRFEETRWIKSEDVNVEHLLDVFTTIDANSDDVWNACFRFTVHLYWHKPRLVILRPRIEGLPDDYPPKPQYFFELSRLLYSVGNYVESKRLLVHALKLWRERGSVPHIARTLMFLSGVDGLLGLHKEGIRRAQEALTIYERLNDVSGQAQSWQYLARSLYHDKQLDAAEDATSRVISLSSDQDDQYQVCQCHVLLGEICHSKGETETAIEHFETALRIASSFNWDDEQFWSHYSLAQAFFYERRFDDARPHIEQSKSHAVDVAYELGRAMELQARCWYHQRRFEEAESEVLCAVDVYKRVGATNDLNDCRELLEAIKAGVSGLVVTHESDGDDRGPGEWKHSAPKLRLSGIPS